MYVLTARTIIITTSMKTIMMATISTMIHFSSVEDSVDEIVQSQSFNSACKINVLQYFTIIF